MSGFLGWTDRGGGDAQPSSVGTDGVVKSLTGSRVFNPKFDRHFYKLSDNGGITVTLKYIVSIKYFI